MIDKPVYNEHMTHQVETTRMLPSVKLTYRDRFSEFGAAVGTWSSHRNANIVLDRVVSGDGPWTETERREALRTLHLNHHEREGWLADAWEMVKNRSSMDDMLKMPI